MSAGGKEKDKKKKKGTHMFLREVFLPRAPVEISFGYLDFACGRPVTRDDKLAHLQLRVRDRAAGDTCVGRPVESAEEYVLTPTVRVLLVDIVDAAVSDHDLVRRSWKWGIVVTTRALGRYWKGAKTHDVRRGDL